MKRLQLKILQIFLVEKVSEMQEGGEKHRQDCTTDSKATNRLQVSLLFLVKEKRNCVDSLNIFLLDVLRRRYPERLVLTQTIGRKVWYFICEAYVSEIQKF
jgi:hypothetical protein